jgi:hypothetical protein
VQDEFLNTFLQHAETEAEGGVNPPNLIMGVFKMLIFIGKK